MRIDAHDIAFEQALAARGRGDRACDAASRGAATPLRARALDVRSAARFPKEAQVVRGGHVAVDPRRDLRPSPSSDGSKSAGLHRAARLRGMATRRAVVAPTDARPLRAAIARADRQLNPGIRAARIVYAGEVERLLAGKSIEHRTSRVEDASSQASWPHPHGAPGADRRARRASSRRQMCAALGSMLAINRPASELILGIELATSPSRRRSTACSVRRRSRRPTSTPCLDRAIRRLDARAPACRSFPRSAASSTAVRSDQ